MKKRTLACPRRALNSHHLYSYASIGHKGPEPNGQEYIKRIGTCLCRTSIIQNLPSGQQGAQRAIYPCGPGCDGGQLPEADTQ